MKKHIDKILIFLATIVTGILISISFTEGNEQTLFNMKSKEYKKAIDERNLLYKKNSDLRNENELMMDKLKDYHQGEENHLKILEDMKAQLKDYSNIVGTTNVEGSGIVIRITDGYYDMNKSTKYERDIKTLHSIDAALVLSELRNAGAEALAINGYRVLGDTSVECNWAFIGFNDNKQTMEAQPFHFYALGDPDQLEAAILGEGSYINKLLIRKLNVEVEKRENIKLPITAGNLEPQFMQRVDS